MLAIRLVPPEVLSECRLRAGEMVGRAKRFGSIAAAVIALFWLAVALWLYAWWTAG